MVYFPQDAGLGQFVDGGGWKTTITLVNISDKVVQYRLTFFRDDGGPLTAQFVGMDPGTVINGAIPTQGSVTFETPGTAAPLTQGWALLQPADATSRIAGQAIFRRSGGGLPDIEAVVPFDDVLGRRQMMPFDNTSGYLTGLAIANPSPTTSMLITFSFRDTGGGQFFQDTMTVAPANHTAFLFSQRWAQTANRRGVLEITSNSGDPNAGALVLGLRGSPSGSLSTIMPIISSSW